MGSRSTSWSRLAAGLAALALAGGASADPPPGPRPRRILSIHSFEPGVPVEAIFTSALRAELPVGAELQLYSETLDRLRFPGPGYEDGFRAWLKAKYASAPPDAIVAVGLDALRFASEPATAPFPGVPVVFGLVPDDTVEARHLPRNVTGVTEHFAIRETLALALALFPGTRRIVLVGGASEQDRPQNELLSREARSGGAGLEVEELFGLAMTDLEARLRALPERSAVLVVSFFEDGAGRHWVGPQSVPVLSAASPAPVFTFYAHLVGYGAVGGVSSDAAASGRRVARTLMRVLFGESAERVPVEHGGANRVILDARQLARFGVPEARLPADAEVRFRTPTLWEARREAVVVVGVAFLVQTALIALLLVERRRRARAEARARANLVAVARMNRLSALGELVVSLAHEINSPLGAVLNNAEAALRTLDAGKEHEAEVRACLVDIARDVTRASEVIQRIRGMLRREGRAAPMDVSKVLRDAVRLVATDARDRGVDLEVECAPDLPVVAGDDVQLGQVVLNLLLNAFDAVAILPETRRRVRVAAEGEGRGVAIRVEDSGPGIAGEVADRIFEPFVSTKPGGLGMGLSISRSIVEEHGGSIAVARGALGGAAFVVRLPEAHGASEAPRGAATG